MQDAEHALCEREVGINGYWEGWRASWKPGEWGGERAGVVGGEGTGLFLDLSNKDLTTNGLMKQLKTE